MSFRLYLDENVDPSLAFLLRDMGYDVVSAHDIGLAGFGVPDEAQLEYAAGHGRVLFTQDLKTFGKVAERWHNEGRVHPGLVLCEQSGNRRVLLRRLVLLLEEYDPAVLRGAVTWLPRLPSE